MTYDPLSGHSKKKAVVKPEVEDSADRCDRNLDFFFFGVGFFKEAGE